METSPKVIKIERMDDIPLLLAQMKKMEIASLLGTHFPTHGNWQPRRVRIDSTTAKSYVAVEPDGLFQLGHSKEHRPDLPQLKINQATLDPLGLPLTMTIVSGECADDPLYVPEIRKVQNCLKEHGVLFVGDCKMAALPTRAYLAATEDYYLCPLPAVGTGSVEWDLRKSTLGGCRTC